SDFTDPTLRRFKTVERGHGRDETREYFVAAAPAALLRQGEWKDVASIVSDRSGDVRRTAPSANRAGSHASTIAVNRVPTPLARLGRGWRSGGWQRRGRTGGAGLRDRQRRDVVGLVARRCAEQAAAGRRATTWSVDREGDYLRPAAVVTWRCCQA